MALNRRNGIALGRAFLRKERRNILIDSSFSDNGKHGLKIDLIVAADSNSSRTGNRSGILSYAVYNINMSNEAKQRKLDSLIEQSQANPHTAYRLGGNASFIEGVCLLKFTVKDFETFARIVQSMKGKKGAMAYIPINDDNRFIFRQVFSIFTKQSNKVKRRFLYGDSYLGISECKGKLIVICGDDENHKEQVLEVEL